MQIERHREAYREQYPDGKFNARMARSLKIVKLFCFSI